MIDKTKSAQKGAVKKAAAKKSVTAKSASKDSTKVEKGVAKKSAAKKTVAKKNVEAVDMTQNEIDVIVNAILDKKGKNVCSMDLRKVGSGICDFFVVCNADSTVNVSAIADNIEDEMIVKCNRKLVRSQGKENSFWIIQDYGDIVVHIFLTEYRDFYRLEELWSDCDKKVYDEE